MGLSKANQTSFKKGQISWNKDKKGVMKPNKTSFVKGMTPWNKGSKGVQISPRKGKIGIPSSKKGKKYPQLSGENSGTWKGGITPENSKIRNSIEYSLWRDAIFARDNWTCQKYGIKGGDLEVHHINNFSEYPEIRLAIDNGITLSKKAHREFHKQYGYKNNTLEQLLEFLKK